MGTNHAFPLWFSRVAVSSDGHFIRNRPPIEVIEVSGPFWGCVFSSFKGGVEIWWVSVDRRAL